MKKQKLVVIGNGMAGARAVEEILERGGAEQFEIAMFGEEPTGNPLFRPNSGQRLRCCKSEDGTVLAVGIIACLTNPRVRFGRGPVALNDWTPYLFKPRYPCTKSG